MTQGQTCHRSTAHPRRRAGARIAFAALLPAAALLLQACGQTQTAGTVANPGGERATESRLPEGQRRDLARGGNRGGRARVRVNRFAWQAALDSVSFMPIKTSDPYGGVIATDWYRPDTSPNERLRVNIIVGGPDLAGDTVKVTIFKETRDRRGQWQPAKVNEASATDLENVILTRARRARQDAG